MWVVCAIIAHLKPQNIKPGLLHSFRKNESIHNITIESVTLVNV